jgi:hypothetical protein
VAFFVYLVGSPGVTPDLHHIRGRHFPHVGAGATIVNLGLPAFIAVAPGKRPSTGHEKGAPVGALSSAERRG